MFPSHSYSQKSVSYFFWYVENIRIAHRLDAHTFIFDSSLGNRCCRAHRGCRRPDTTLPTGAFLSTRRATNKNPKKTKCYCLVGIPASRLAAKLCGTVFCSIESANPFVGGRVSPLCGPAYRHFRRGVRGYPTRSPSCSELLSDSKTNVKALAPQLTASLGFRGLWH